MRFFFMLRIYLRVLLITWRVYGFGQVFLTWLVAEPFMRLFTSVTLAADHLFFPGFREAAVRRPVFILGHPRSGTTFLHHLLTRADGAAPFLGWHLFFPALTARRLMKPLIDLLIKKGKTVVLPEETGHKMELNQPDEEEMLFLQNYDTNFITIGMLSFDERDYPELQYHDRQPSKARLSSMRFLDGCFRRHLYATGARQIIAQTHFSTFRLKTMLDYYPDAKFIFVLRNPHQVVPSFLSLLHNSIKHRWGIDAIAPELLQRYNEHRFQGMVDLYRYFYELDKNKELPADRVMILPFTLLRDDLETAFAQVAQFCGLKVSEEVWRLVRERAAKQKAYRRPHQVMDLATFGLSHERISKEFSFIFKEYGLEDRWE